MDQIYIFNGESHNNFTASYMAALGMDQEQMDSVIAQRDFELSQNAKKRSDAYKKESDPLFLEALRKSYEGDEEGAEAARALGLEAVDRIKARFPLGA